MVIPTKNRVADLCQAIDSMLGQTVPPYEIVIVDSSKSSELNTILKKRFSTTSVLIKYLHTKSSLTEARNIGVQHSAGDLLFFFDDDVILERNYIEQAINIFMNDRKAEIGGAMGDITNLHRDTTSLNALIRRLFFMDHFGDGKFLPSGLPTWVHGERKVMKTEFLSGCASAYRRRVLNEFVFDEELGRLSGYCYLEDADISYRISRKYILMYTPLARLEHHPSSKARVETTLTTKQLVINHSYLFHKNMPKKLSTVFAFCLSLIGTLLIYGIWPRSGKGVAGWFQGILHVV